MSAYGYDEDGEREHDCCDRCGRGSCPGSGSQGEHACTDHLRRAGLSSTRFFTDTCDDCATGRVEIRCALPGHDGDRFLCYRCDITHRDADHVGGVS